MSTNIVTFDCSICHQHLSSNLFIRNQQTNTFYKTCLSCRTRRNDRRQNLHRQRSVAPLPTIASVNEVGISGNEIIADTADTHINDIEMGMETNNKVIIYANLNNNSNNQTMNNVLMFCGKCKRSRHSDLFTGRVRGRTYKTCSDCRIRDNYRRHIQAHQPQTNIGNNIPSIVIDNPMKYCTRCKKNCFINLFTDLTENSSYTTCSACRLSERSRWRPPIFQSIPTNSTSINSPGEVDDIYDASDNENHIVDEGINHPINEEAVGEEATGDDEPLIILSQTDTREYAAHMRLREALPDNHDDIFNNIPQENIIPDENGPFMDIDDILNNESTTNNANNLTITEEPAITIPIDNTRNQTPPNTTVPRRLRQWLAPLPTHRTIPAAYLSRHNRNLLSHNLDRCTSVCPSCHALHWPQEGAHSSSVARPRFQTCCKEGQVVLDEVPEPPAYPRWLWTSDDRDARDSRINSRNCNRAFAFTSFKYTEDRRLADIAIHGGLRSFSIHGQIYHQNGAALREEAVPRYALLYFVGLERAIEARTEGTNLNPEIVRRLTELIEQNNPFVEYYHTALRSLQESEQEGSLRMVLNPEFRLVLEQNTDRR